MSWKTIMKISEEEAAGGVEPESATRGELGRAASLADVGTYGDLLKKIGKLWVTAKGANAMEQKILLGQMRKQIREENIPESD